MEILNLDINQNQLYYNSNLRMLYGVSNQFYFYITQRKEKDTLTFSIKGLNEVILEEIKKEESIIISEIDINGCIYLNMNYFLESDERLLSEINKITTIFKQNSIQQCCEVSQNTSDILFYDLESRLGIITEDMFNERFKDIRLQKLSKKMKQFILLIVGLPFIWQIIGWLAYPYVLGNVNLYSSSFSYSSEPLIYFFFFSLLSSGMLSATYMEITKKKIICFLSIPLSIIVSALSIFIMDGISIHRVFKLNITISSIFEDTVDLYHNSGLLSFLINDLLAGVIAALIMSIIMTIVMILKEEVEA